MHLVFHIKHIENAKWSNFPARSKKVSLVEENGINTQKEE